MKNNFKLILALISVSIILTSFFNISVLNDEISDNQYNILMNDLSNVTTNFNIWIDNKEELLEISKDVIDNFDYDALIHYKTSNPFLNINHVENDVSQLYIGLNNGDFITGGQWVPSNDYDPRTRVWYKSAVQADDTIVSPVYIDKETNDQLVTISSPLYIKDVFVGVISADIFLNSINNYLDNLLIEKNIYIYLTDDEGTVIAHTNNAGLIGKNVFSEIKNDKISTYYDEAKSTLNIVKMKYDYDGRQIKGIVQYVSKGSWYLTVAAVDDSSFMHHFAIGINDLLFNLFILILILTLLYIIFKMKSDLVNENKLLVIDNEKDFLTGIYNRRYFNLWVEDFLKSPQDTKKISLLMMDIDKFKEYNDTYGHLKGDEVIIAVADTINQQIRKGDIFARYGGEEFVLFLDDVTEDAAVQIAEKLRQSIEDLNICHAQSDFKYITLSIGVVTLVPTAKTTLNQLVNFADLALYKAKEMGRNVVFEKGIPSEILKYFNIR